MWHVISPYDNKCNVRPESQQHARTGLELATGEGRRAIRKGRPGAKIERWTITGCNWRTAGEIIATRAWNTVWQCEREEAGNREQGKGRGGAGGGQRRTRGFMHIFMHIYTHTQTPTHKHSRIHPHSHTRAEHSLWMSKDNDKYQLGFYATNWHWSYKVNVLY